MGITKLLNEINTLSYQNIMISPFNIKLQKLSVDQCINEHGRMYFTGTVPEAEEVRYIEADSAGTNIELKCFDSIGSEVVLFSGITTKMEIKADKDVYTIEGEAVSHSYVMDVKIRNCSFQDKDMLYNEMIKKVISAYDKSDFIDMCCKTEKLKKFIIQYNETDWAFLKRMASHFNCGLIPDITQNKPKFWFGMPKGTDFNIIEDFHYSVEKRISDFRTTSENHIQDMQEEDFIYFDVESTQHMNIGDTAVIKGKKLVVFKKNIIMENGIVKNNYLLVSEKGLRQIKTYNCSIKGTSLEGKVIDVKEDNIRVHIEIDKEQNKEKAYWFPYSTFYTTEGQTGWYCMPELGDSVKLYFPTKKEEEAVIINSIRKRSKGGDKITKPDVKFFRTSFGKELMFNNEEMVVTAKDGKILMRLNENGGVEVFSTKNVTVVAVGKLKMSSEKNVVISAESKIDMGCKESVVVMDGSTNLKGKKIKRISTGDMPKVPAAPTSTSSSKGAMAKTSKPQTANEDAKAKTSETQSTKKEQPGKDEIKSKLSRNYPEEPDVDKYLIFQNAQESQIDPVFARRLAALARDHGKKISLNEGFRTRQEQEQRYIASGGKKNSKGEWEGGNGGAAKPGRSWHEFGEAVDTNSSWLKSLNKSEKTEEQEELLKYGIFKPLTPGNKAMGRTGKAKMEDWHIQPVETNSAAAIGSKKSFSDAYKE